MPDERGAVRPARASQPAFARFDLNRQGAVVVSLVEAVMWSAP